MSKPRTGAPKRVAVGLLAGALAMFGVALAPQAGATASVTTSRLAGTTRYGTAAAIAASSTFSAPTTAIVSTGENFPDALAASTLAGANAQAPIILTESKVYSADAKTALAALKTKGVSAVTIVGGTVAVAQSVEDAIKADGFTVTRVAGDDRYETAAAIATAANTKSAPAAIGGLKTALIATGTNYPDALAGGPAAYANKLPLLLVSDTVPAETSNAISTLGIKKVVILGGTAAVSSTVEAQLVTATGNPATRLAGTNRYSTATAVADYEKATLLFPTSTAVLATGVNFPDALAAGPLGGQNKAPIILTASLPPESAAWLDANSSTLSTLLVSGGTSAVDDATVASAKTSAQNTGNDSAAKAVTTRPELTGASIVATTTTLQATPTTPAGTSVRFTFDEAVSTSFPNFPALFHVYSASDGGTATANGTSATVETGGLTVLVNFGALSTAASAANLTEATSDFGAVKDVGGADSPEGSAPIGTAGTVTVSGGTTAAPDLRTVGNFRQAALVGQTAVDFTFDQAAFLAVASASNFHLVDVNGGTTADHACTGPVDTVTPSGGTSAGGNGTTVITVICTNIGGVVNTTAGTAYTANNIARGYVTEGSVASSTGGPVTNPLEAADVAANSLGPDLTAVGVTVGTTDTTAVFTFDQAISTAVSTMFRLYRTDGTFSSGSSTVAAVINTANATQVSVTFPTLTATPVGGSVLGNGTVGSSSASGVISINGQGNYPDEEASAGSAGSAVTPGKVAGPDLLSVALSTTTDVFGVANGYKASYTFDVSVTTGGVDKTKFFLYFSDGTKYSVGSSGACVSGDGVTASATVTCSGYVNALTLTAPSPAATGVGPAVLGTVDNNAVIASTGGLSNPEGAFATTGGTGTAAS